MKTIASLFSNTSTKTSSVSKGSGSLASTHSKQGNAFEAMLAQAEDTPAAAAPPPSPGAALLKPLPRSLSPRSNSPSEPPGNLTSANSSVNALDFSLVQRSAVTPATGSTGSPSVVAGAVTTTAALPRRSPIELNTTLTSAPVLSTPISRVAPRVAARSAAPATESLPAPTSSASPSLMKAALAMRAAPQPALNEAAPARTSVPHFVVSSNPFTPSPRANRTAAPALASSARAALRSTEAQDVALVQSGAPQIAPLVQVFGTNSPKLKATAASTGAANGQPSAPATKKVDAHAPLLTPALSALEAMSARSKAVQQAQRVSTNAVSANGALPAPSKKRVASPGTERGTEEPRDLRKIANKDEHLPTAPLIQTSPNSPTRQQAVQVTDAAPLPQVPPAFESMLPQIIGDPSLRIALMPHTARVSVDTAEAGRVSVQVKVTDGVAELRASGPAAAALDLRQNELRVALAHEGLAMGHFDLTQHGQGQQQRSDQADANERSAWPTTRLASSSSPTEALLTGDGRVHVKA